MIPGKTTTPTQTRTLVTARVYFFICLLFPLAIYSITLAPTVYTFDSAEFATGAYTLGIIHPTGYPFYLVLAKLFTLIPIGDIAYRVNWMSALFGAISTSLLFLLCLRITHNELTAAATSLLFAFSRFYWREAVIAEIYTLNATLVLAIFLIILVNRYTLSPIRSAAAGLVFGLALANHMSSTLLVPALAYWVYANKLEWRALLSFALFTLSGLLFYIYLPVRYAANPPLNYAATYMGTDLTMLSGIWSWMTGEVFRQFMIGYSVPELIGETLIYAGWLWSNFLGVGVLLGTVGMATMARKNRELFLFTLLVYLAFTSFFIGYRVVDKDTMFSVSYLVWAIWIAFGSASFAGWISVRWNAETGIAVLVAIVAVVSLVVNYALVDQSRNTMARDFAGRLLAEVAPSAFIMTEWTWATPLEYLQIVEGSRPDVIIYDRGLAALGIWSRLRKQGVPDESAATIIDNTLASEVSRQIMLHPVYATEYDQSLADKFDFIQQGRYYRLEPRSATGSPP